MRASLPNARSLLALASAAALGAAGCAVAPPKMTFMEAGFHVAPGSSSPEAAREPEVSVEPPVAVPAPESFATEIPTGPPVDAILVRFAVDSRARRGRHAAHAGFPDETIAAWRSLAGELDRYLGRALPQTPLLELIRARVTVEAEWEYDERRYGAAPHELEALVRSRTAGLARRLDAARALGAALFARPPPARLRWPVEQAGLSSMFGMRMHPLEGKRRMHLGVDHATAAGRVVSAAAAGWVVRAGWTGGYGLMVEVRHPGDLTTRYSHLSAILCAPGDAVDPGQPLGLVGKTGLATGPHLHFEVWRGGEPRDPLPWLGMATSSGSAGGMRSRERGRRDAPFPEKERRPCVATDGGAGGPHLPEATARGGGKPGSVYQSTPPAVNAPDGVGRRSVTAITEALLALAVCATLDVTAGEDLARTLARARPGDVVRLGPGTHRGSFGRLAGVTIEGAGLELTEVVAPEGEDGLVAAGEATLRGLSLRAGPSRCALKVLGGAVRLEGVALSGGSCGAFVDGGVLEGRGVDLAGEYGLLLRVGSVRLEGGTARGSGAGLGVLGGTLALRRFDVVGPAREAGLSVSRGSASLFDVTIRAPGPSGIAVSGGGKVEGVAVTITGAAEWRGFLGDCVQVRRGALSLSGATLAGCAGAAVEASGGDISLHGVDAVGGAAGCLVFLDGASAALEGNLCTGRGPGLVLASGARASAVANRWWTDPVLWVDCGSGARVKVGRGEEIREPCAAAR